MSSPNKPNYQDPSMVPASNAGPRMPAPAPSLFPSAPSHPMSPTSWSSLSNTQQLSSSQLFFWGNTLMSSQPAMNAQQILPSFQIPMANYSQGPHANTDYSQRSSTSAVSEGSNRTTLQHCTVMREDKNHQQHLSEAVTSGNALEGCAAGGRLPCMITPVKKIKRNPSKSLGSASTSSISSNPSDVPVVSVSQSENVKATLPSGSEMKTKVKEVKRNPSKSLGSASTSSISSNPSDVPVVSVSQSENVKATLPSGSQMKIKRKGVKRKPSNSLGSASTSRISSNPSGRFSSEELERINYEIGMWQLNKVDGETVLHRAATNGRPDMVRYCISYLKMSPDCVNNHGLAPLHEACIHGHENVVEALLDLGADCSKTSPGGESPLHLAASKGRVEIVKLLLCISNLKMSPDCVNNHGLAPLHEACIHGHENVVEALLDLGADCSKTSPGGESPLHLAASKGRVEIVKLLLSRGADPNQRTERGESVIDVAGPSLFCLLLPHFCKDRPQTSILP